MWLLPLMTRGRKRGAGEVRTQRKGGLRCSPGPPAMASTGSLDLKALGASVAGSPNTSLVPASGCMRSTLDARAIAGVLRQEGESLPAVTRDDDSSMLELLTVERDAAVAEATRLRNQLHAHLMQLDPEYRQHLPRFRTVAGLAELRAFTADDDDPLRSERAATVRRLAARLELALQQADEVAERIRLLAATRYMPLTRLCGINLLTAGAIAGMLGPGLRFASDAELAAYAGVSPWEASSAGKTRHRLNRSGNRRLNAVFYRIALTQAQHLPEARAYLERRVTEGKTRREAHRALRRYLARAVFKLWRECFPVENTTYTKASRYAFL